MVNCYFHCPTYLSLVHSPVKEAAMVTGSFGPETRHLAAFLAAIFSIDSPILSQPLPIFLNEEEWGNPSSDASHYPSLSYNRDKAEVNMIRAGHPSFHALWTNDFQIKLEQRLLLELNGDSARILSTLADDREGEAAFQKKMY